MSKLYLMFGLVGLLLLAGCKPRELVEVTPGTQGYKSQEIAGVVDVQGYKSQEIAGVVDVIQSETFSGRSFQPECIEWKTVTHEEIEYVFVIEETKELNTTEIDFDYFTYQIYPHPSSTPIFTVGISINLPSTNYPRNCIEYDPLHTSVEGDSIPYPANLLLKSTQHSIECYRGNKLRMNVDIYRGMDYDKAFELLNENKPINKTIWLHSGREKEEIVRWNESVCVKETLVRNVG